MPFLFPRSLACAAPSTQGHVEAAGIIGSIYYWGQGVAVDYKRAMAAYKIGAEGGDAHCQYELASMLRDGEGIDSPDYKQAVVWFEKAAAQDFPNSINSLGGMAVQGQAQLPSFRRARELFQRASDLGSKQAAENLQILREDIQEVTRSSPQTPANQPAHPPFPIWPSWPPSWTSGSRSTAPPATT